MILMPKKIWRSLRQSGDQAPSRTAIEWAIRLFLGRSPRIGETAVHYGHVNLDSLRQAFSETAEFRAFLLSHNGWSAPLFLLEPPSNPAIPMVLRPPSLAEPTSQLCTEAQFHESLYAELCKELGMKPTFMHRKPWEFIWILAVLRHQGLLKKGVRALGFGVGKERLPSYFAKLGMDVMATDAPPAIIKGQGWDTTGQHAAGWEQIWRRSIVRRAQFEKHVSFAFTDMNNIPESFKNFDFCWSACCFEHLGSIENGLDFVRNSLETLKPGGFAIHTTEFNLTSNDDTFESPGLALFRRQDIERLYGRLIEEGHKPWAINLFPGSGKVDSYVDLPPFSTPHLKLQVNRYVTTSIGLVVQKRFE
jgi:SAM-dependent methyltransferase